MPQVLFVEGKASGESSAAGESSSSSSPAEKALRGAKEFDVCRAERAEEAFEERRLFRPSSGEEGPSIPLLVTAHFLPRVNGPELVEQLREAGADLPILLLTSRQDAEDRAEVLRRGADDCMSRPVEPKELTARLRALLRRPERWQPVKELQIGPLLVDADGQEAYAYGDALGLRRKELNFLYLLAGRYPRVVTRDQIATRVWGGAHVTGNSIDVTTSGLRDKLEGALPEGTAELRIETVRGVGYRLQLNAEG